jgi:hypothetical protein
MYGTLLYLLDVLKLSMTWLKQMSFLSASLKLSEKSSILLCCILRGIFGGVIPFLIISCRSRWFSRIRFSITDSMNLIFKRKRVFDVFFFLFQVCEETSSFFRPET